MAACPPVLEFLHDSQLLLAPQQQIFPMQTSSTRKCMWPLGTHLLLFFIIILVSAAHPLALSQNIHRSRARWRRLRELQNLQSLNTNESKELDGRMRKDDTYDAPAFDSSHTSFKTQEGA
jgi:hypothetical protein